MSRTDDEIRRRLRSTREPIETEDVVTDIEHRADRVALTRRVGTPLLAIIVLVLTVTGYAALHRAFETVAIPAERPTPTAPPAGDDTCATRVVQGRFEQGGGLDTAVLSCEQDHWKLAYDWGAGHVGESTTLCRFDCRFWAVADVNGNGTDELIMWSAWRDAADGAEWYPLGYLFILEPPQPFEGAWTPKQFGQETPKGLPSVDGMTVFPIGADEGRTATLSCGQDALTWSVSHQLQDGRWIAHSVRFRVADVLHLVDDMEEQGLSEAIGQPSSLCGSSILGLDHQRPPADASPGTLPGVSYPVCDVQGLRGGFGDLADGVVLFREVSPLGQGCLVRGYQHIALVHDGTVLMGSEQLVNDIPDAPDPWLYATPDVDGDGMDEIALGIAGSRADGYARIILFDVTTDSDGATVPVSYDCGSNCETTPWVALGTLMDSREGAYCGSIAEGGPTALIRWSTVETRIEGTAWYLQGDTLAASDQRFSRPDDGTSYPDDGLEHLCGDPVTWPDESSSATP